MMKLEIGILCEKLAEEGQPWSGIFLTIHPKLKCPIKQVWILISSFFG
jgi:hypothetical protein